MRLFNLGSPERIPPGEGRAFVVGERTVAVFRGRQGQLYATEPRCPHLGGPLADGTLGGDTLMCPLHGFKFRLSTGEALSDGCSRLVTYPVVLSDAGEMLLWL